VVVALPVNAKLPPILCTVNCNPVVLPNPTVVISLYETCEPDQTAVNCPALAADPDFATYSNHAPSYDPVGIEYTVNAPDAVNVFTAVVINALLFGFPRVI